MSTQQPVLTITLRLDVAALGDVGLEKGTLVQTGGVPAAGGAAVGVLDDDAWLKDVPRGQTYIDVPVIVYGVALVIAGGAVTRGAAVASSAAGAAVAAAAGDQRVGVALDGVAAGDLPCVTRVLLTPGAYGG